jgi:LysM repeat protein
VDLIADRFEVTAYQIRRWNNIKNPQLAPGRVLRLYVEVQSSATSKPSRSKPGAKTTHASTAKKIHSSTASTAKKKPPVSGTSPARTSALAVQ